MNEGTRLKEIITILKNNNIVNGLTPDKLYNIFSELGPTFIKIGQIMSNRYDILPKEYCQTLAKLRSNVSPMDYKEVEEILKEEYDDINEIFKFIDPSPIGSASIAQVHKAILKTGEEVVIKVQRKNIYETMSLDIKLLKKAINILHLNHFIKIIDLKEVIDEVFNITKEEMNFEIEARNLIEAKENNKEISYIEIPKVYQNLTTKRTLIMERIVGVNLVDISKLKTLGYDPQDIGLKLANNYIKQALDDGLFHADLHPDNILIRDGKIVLIDLGMMGRLSMATRIQLKKCMQAIISNDIYEVERILLNLCTTKEDIDHTKLRSNLEKILAQNAYTNIKEIQTIDFFNSIFNLLKTFNLKLNNDIIMLIRGITVIEGTLEVVAPNINLITVLSNKVKEMSFQELITKEKLIQNTKNLINSTTSLSKLPSEFLTLITNLNRGEAKVGIEMTNSDKQIDKLETMLHQIIIGILDASLILGSSLVKNTLLRNSYIFLAIVLSIWLLIKMYLDHIHKGL